MNETQMQMLAAQLAARHAIPKATVSHPAVIVPGDEFMTEKLADPNYVPYCLVKPECGRVRRRVYGFECPTCGNQMNYDLTHYDGNKTVQYTGEAPAPEAALAGFPPVPGEFWKFRGRPEPLALAQHRAEHAERDAWNQRVAARKAEKKARSTSGRAQRTNNNNED